MDRDVLVEKVRACHALPTLPAVAVEVLKLARSSRTSLVEIATQISRDPALSGKILKTVNSAFYSLPKAVTTISSAVAILGMETVKTLALGFCLVRSFNDDPAAAIHMAHWRRAIYSATAARVVSRRLEIAQCEEVCLGALLQDIGVSVLRQVVGKEYDAMLAEENYGGSRLHRRCRSALGMDHAEAGNIVAAHWNLPSLLTDVIRWHHSPESARPEHREACRIARLASLCAEVFMDTGRTVHCVRVARRYGQKALALPPGVTDLVLAEVGQTTKELADLFEVDIGRQQSYEDILSEATQTLAELTLQSQRRALDLKIQAETDSLTGLANRRKLEEELGAEFSRAQKFLRPLSVIFLDVDFFKKVNDTRGHAAGDRVLKRLADIIRSLTRPMDTAARYGGEEFVILLPEMSLIEASRLAESLRRRVEASPPVDARDCPITVSAGVAAFDGASHFRNADQLLLAADRATYAAKKAGRNTIRIFSPRVKSPT